MADVTDKDREAARNALLKCYTRRDPFVREVGVVAAAIATARAEEREAIAMLADNYVLYGRNGIRIAQAIRALAAQEQEVK